MSSEENVQIVKSFLATLGGRDKQGLLALTAEDLEWIVRARTGHLPVLTAAFRAGEPG